MDEQGITHLLTKVQVDKVRTVGKEVYSSCPFARWRHQGGTDKHPSFSIEINDEGMSRYNCFTCKAGGSLEEMVMLLREYDSNYGSLYEEVKDEHLTNMYKKVKRLHTKEDKVSTLELEKQVRDDAELKPFLKTMVKYPLKRGLTIETCKRWELGYDDGFRRLVFPIREAGGGLVGMQGRTIDPPQPDVPKYYNYWNFKKSHFLYGAHLVSEENRDLFIVEGMFDTIRISQFGVDAVGIMGSEGSRQQINHILSLGDKNIYVMLDGDDAGRAGQKSLLKKLHGRASMVYGISLPPGMDPGELNEEEFERFKKEAVLS